MTALNPYKAPAGTELDLALHQRFFGNDTPPLPYSTEDKAADKLKALLKSKYGFPVLTGETRTRPRKYFARFDSGPSTATETLAETYALAMARLALVISEKRDPSAH